MEDQPAPVRAAIDIGSNTIHIIVACCQSDDLDILADEQELVRIGTSVSATGEISPQKRDAAIATLLKYKALAEQYTSEPILVVATEAIRKARNSQQFQTDIQQATGLLMHIIDGAVESTLTFYGATYELYKEPQIPPLVGILDLGGGSMELVIARKKQLSWHTSVPIGSGWLYDRYFRADPPTQDDLEVARTFLHTYFLGMPIKQSPPVLIATGGSANSLLLLARCAFELSEQEMHLTYEQIVRCEELLSTLTAEEVSQRYGQPLKRARILPAGALILDALMTQLQLSQIRVSTHGIREGVLLASVRYGAEWLQHVKENAQTTLADEVVDQSSHGQDNDEDAETFAHSGHLLLLERTRKMLEWRKEVLKHEDVEAVHKMRVASRRLRAVLDAYEAACDPKKFKAAYRAVKEVADVLGKARDTDVMISNLRQELESAPHEASELPELREGLQWLVARLDAYRQTYQKQVEVFLQGLDETALAQRIESCLPERGSDHGKS